MNKTRSLKVINKHQETANTVTLHLKPTDHQPMEYQAGQFLTFIFKNLGVQEVRRSYSISSAPSVDNILAITVKKVSNGLASKYLTEVVEVGETLTCLAPAGQFTIQTKPENQRDIFLIGGGSGVTPLFSIIKETLNKEVKSRVTLLLANRNKASIIFKKELDALATQFSEQFQIIHFLSQPKDKPTSSIKNIRYQTGYISNFYIEQLVNKHLQFEKDKAQFFICGPEGLMLKAQMIVNFIGFPKSNIHKEIFVIKELPRPDFEQLPDAQVLLRTNQQTYEFKVKSGQNLLEAASQAGLELPFNCKSGICTVCACQCETGIVKMYTQEGVFDSDIVKGLVFTCVGYPLTEKIELEL